MRLACGAQLLVEEKSGAWVLSCHGIPVQEEHLCDAAAAPRDVQIFALGVALGALMRVRSELMAAARAMGVTTPTVQEEGR